MHLIKFIVFNSWVFFYVVVLVLASISEKSDLEKLKIVNLSFF